MNAIGIIIVTCEALELVSARQSMVGSYALLSPQPYASNLTVADQMTAGMYPSSQLLGLWKSLVIQA